MGSPNAGSALYSIYGLTVAVIGAHGRLAAASGSEQPQVTLDLRGFSDAALSAATEQIYGPQAASKLRIFRDPDGKTFAFRFPEDIEFLVDAPGLLVRGRWPAQFSLDYVAPLILGPLMGYLLRLHGITTLHASVVEIDGRAVAITGHGGAGKSTAAAAFAKKRVPVLSDDLAPMQIPGGEVEVSPGYPRICLWPESVRMLFGREDALPLLTEGWEKRYLDLTGDGYCFGRQAIPLARIYWLSERTGDPGSPVVQPLSPQQALTGLIANTYAAWFGGRGQAVSDLRTYSRLVSTVPVKRIAPGGAVDALCESIMKDVSHVYR